MVRFGSLLSALLIGFCLMALPAKANDRLEEARVLVSEMAQGVKQAVEADYENEEAKIAVIDSLIEAYFDFDGITRFSAGRYWRSASDAEKAEYATLFRTVLTGLAVRQFDQLKGLNYTVTDVVAKGDKLALVTGIMSDPTGANADAVVSWRVGTIKGKPVRIIDVEIENISMLVTQQQENTAIIRKNGGQFSSLIEAMRKAASEL